MSLLYWWGKAPSRGRQCFIYLVYRNLWTKPTWFHCKSMITIKSFYLLEHRRLSSRSLCHHRLRWWRVGRHVRLLRRRGGSGRWWWGRPPHWWRSRSSRGWSCTTSSWHFGATWISELNFESGWWVYCEMSKQNFDCMESSKNLRRLPAAPLWCSLVLLF